MRLLRATILGAAVMGGAAQLTNGLSDPNPEFFPGSLHRRMGTCGPDQHSCLDINGTGLLSTGLCCDNSKYCMIDTSYAAVCCDLGSNCGLPCAASEYVCKGTVTTTISGRATAIPTQSCCARSCPQTGNFLCPSELGGGCCAYGSNCLAGGKCAFVPTATNTVSSSTSTSTSTSVPLAQNSKGGLSNGAKAGIGGGIAGLALVITGLVIYFCVWQRRRARQQDSDASSSANATSQADFGKKRPSPGQRQTADYFGPEAKAGPYTDAWSPGLSPIQKGVPISPQAPGDIAVPVEIDSGVSSPGSEAERLKKTPTVREYPIEMPS